MQPTLVVAFLMLIVFCAAAIKVMRRRGSRFGAGAAGTVYELLNEDKRKAIEIIVEGRAEERDAETVDGDLPQLESPERPRR
jgi:hypothetical protein